MLVGYIEGVATMLVGYIDGVATMLVGYIDGVAYAACRLHRRGGHNARFTINIQQLML